MYDKRPDPYPWTHRYREIARVVDPRVPRSLAALTRTSGLAAQLAARHMVEPSVPRSIAALTGTNGLAAQLASRHRIAPSIAALSDTHRRTLQSDLTSLATSNRGALAAAIRDIKAASDGYAASTWSREFERKHEPMTVVPIRDSTARLAELGREVAERREQERREELEHRQESLAIQRAMYEALVASEEARARDARASAEREQMALKRAADAEAREMLSARAQAKQTMFMVKLTVAATAFGGIGSVAAVVAIFVA